MQCLNVKNKEVAALLNEYTEVLGSEDAAYYVLSENNGYGLDKAPNGADSKLFSDLLAHYNGDRNKAILAKSRVYTDSFKNWFGNWLSDDKDNISKVVDENGEPNINSVITTSDNNIYLADSAYNSVDDNGAIDFLFETNSELSKIGTPYEYSLYLNTIFPNSNVKTVYWHGTDSDFSDGLNTAKRGKGSGAPETKNEMYFNKQPWASLQYISGVNRAIPDIEGYNNWVKLWWELKEALGNGRMDTDDWKNEIIGPNTRQTSPNKKGVFDRDKGGEHGKYLSERKARYGYENRTDEEFFEEVFDIRYGQDTFNDWINRKRNEFKNIWSNRGVKKGIIPAVLNVKNPIIEENQNTYYEEQRNLFTLAKENKNDAILSNRAKNEFGSDVAIIFNPNENVYFLGTKSDINQFANWKKKLNNKILFPTNSTSALSSMLNSNDKQTRDMATVLNEVSEKIGVEPVSIQYVDIPLNELYTEATYWTPAVYDRNINTIIVNRNADFGRYGSLENVLLHEIVHALTIDSLSSNTESAKELQKIFNEYKKSHKDHASKNVYEFAAELFSNPEVIRNIATFRDSKSINNLLQKLINWFKNLFGINTKHKELVNLITDNIIEFNSYKTLEKLENDNDFTPNVFPAASVREEIAYDKIKNAFEGIKKTVFNRIGSLKYNVVDKSFDKNESLRTEKLFARLNNISRSVTDEKTLENLNKFIEGSIEYVDSILNSLDEAENVIKKINDKLTDAHTTGDLTKIEKYRNILDNFGAEYIDPHESNLRVLYKELQTEFNTNVYRNLLGEEYFNQILTTISGLIAELSSTKMLNKDNIGYVYSNIVRRTTENFLREEMASAKDPNVDNALKNWLTFDGDLSWYDRNLGLSTSSSSLVRRIIRKVIGDVNAETHKQVYRKFAEINKAMAKVSNPLGILEKDADGKYTGYIIRDRKYGLYQNNKYQWRKKWLKDHKVASVDELRLNNELWLQYQKDYNKWKSENAERRYTNEFYDIFVNLSPEANMALSEINLEIENLTRPFIDERTKKPRFEEMTEDEFEFYNRLLEKKRNLANPYDPITGDLKPEGSVEYNIAMELTAAYEKLQAGLSSKVNMDAFLKEMEYMKKQVGYTPDGKYTLYEAWLERNTKWDFTEEFKQLISNTNKKDYGEVYDKLYEARTNLLKLYRNEKNEPDYTRIPEAVKAKIRQLDIAMHNIRKNTPSDKVKGRKLFKTKLTSVVENMGDRAALTEDDYWVDSNGKVHLYSYVVKVVPFVDKYLHRVPNNNWAETSEESAFYNKNYDPSIPEAEQPKLSIKEYDNRKEYAKVMINPDLAAFRQTFIDTMDEANSKLTHSNYKNNYKLPQRTGTIFNYIGAKGVMSGVKNYMLDAFAITPDDELHGMKVENRPNGTEINILPTMYTTMLNDPSTLNHDLVGSLIRYYKMACNYDNKKKVAPQLNLVDRLINKEGVIRTGDASISAEGSELSKTIHEYIGYHVYGRSKTLGKVGPDSGKVSIDKLFKIFATWGRDIGLSWNIRSAISGLFSAGGFYRSEAFLSRHFNSRDFRAAEWILTKELGSLKLISQLGKNIANSKILGVLEYNGLTFNIEEEFSHVNRWRVGRAITKLVNPYAAFKMASLIPNTIFSTSVYLNYKLIKLEDGKLHFISENDFLNNHFKELSKEEKQAIYDNTKENLWNAYDMSKGYFSVKPEYAEYVNKDLESEISAKLTHIASHAEGMVEEADKSGVYFHTALSTILMFRAFMPKNIENTLSTPHWNYQTKEMMLGTLQSYYIGYKIGADNYMSKMLGVFLSDEKKNENLKKYQELYPDVDMKAEVLKYVHRFHAQILTYLFFLMLSNIIGAIDVDDDDSQLLSFLKLEANKISLELGSRYNAMDLFSILNSLSPLIKTGESLWDAFSPIAYFDETKYKKIKRGAYKGYYGWQRDILKVIPVTNAYFNMKNPDEKLKDFENRLK